MERFVEIVNSIVWSPALVVLLVGAGLYFSIRTRFVQVRRFGHMARLLFRGDGAAKNGSAGFTSFQAFCVALSGRVGTGNIVGVATAIALGGPGAVFWMWVIALLGASTAFMESTLAQKYKFRHKDGWRGGPACYIEQGLGKRWLGVLFAILTIVGYGLLLSMVQSNGISTAFENSFSIKPIITGAVIVALLALIIVGGARRIARVASIVTPFMAVAYIIMAIIIIGINWRAIPGVFGEIFSCAFGVDSAFGGIVGSAIAMGVKRGLFSNEAGQGGGAIVSAGADVRHPAQQGLVQGFSVYVDTLLVCTATALMILCTGTYNVFAEDGTMIAANAPEIGSNYVAFTQGAINTVFHNAGSIFVSIALAFFAFTTMMAYTFYAESSILYIFRDSRSDKAEKAAVWAYRLLFFGSVIYGASTGAGLIWTIGDIGLGLTTWINVIVLLILCPQALAALKDYESTLK
ncbi:MAG: alanine:cation symporter family protein [Bacteroidales bacterium]|nr:alanine:cation symporter family protein [Bacteroidales bacterium]